ncbi:MAG: formamidopyrimidine-DNA glycosylase, partial [Planctomycetota bacterium]
MPELPDIEAYRAALDARIQGATLVELRIAHPFLLRSVELAPHELAGARVVSTERLGKRIALAFDGERFAVLHLMIAGRLHWRERAGAAPKPLRSRAELAAFDFERGSLVLTEA